jgi:hypothetical protein
MKPGGERPVLVLLCLRTGIAGLALVHPVGGLRACLVVAVPFQASREWRLFFIHVNARFVQLSARLDHCDFFRRRAAVASGGQLARRAIADSFFAICRRRVGMVEFGGSLRVSVAHGSQPAFLREGDSFILRGWEPPLEANAREMIRIMTQWRDLRPRVGTHKRSKITIFSHS